MRAGPGGEGESFTNSNSQGPKFQEVRKTRIRIALFRGSSSFGKPLCENVPSHDAVAMD